MAPGWSLRETHDDLAARYRAEGLWGDETLGTVVARGLGEGRDLTFRIWSDLRPWRGTLGDLDGAARRLAAGLRQRGIGPGDIVAFQLPNWMEAAATFWGAALLGAVVVPIVHFYGPKEVGFILRESGAQVLVTADGFGHSDYLAALPAVRAEAAALEHVVVVGERAAAGTVRFDDVLAAGPLDGPLAVDPAQPALVAYTSGTTSNPKGVIHTHRSILAEMVQMSAIRSGHEARPPLVGAPVGHAIGMLSGLLGPVDRVHAVHLMDGWRPAEALAAMAEADLTFLGGATYFLTSLLDDPSCTPAHLARMTRVGLGGSPIPVAVAERAAALGIAITRSYGSTEHPSISGSNPQEPEDKRHRTDGKALPGVDIRLVGLDGSDAGPGEPGEILSRGPELFAGYTDPALTERAMQPGGWYATGDIGVLDEDGYLTITDRKSDIIIRGGENVSAAEVEELLARMAGVAEVAVVAAPDARLGEHACAFVRLQPGAAPVALDDVRAHLDKSGLARQKWPEELRVVDDFPRTPSAKVKKYVLRDQLRAESGG